CFWRGRAAKARRRDPGSNVPNPPGSISIHLFLDLSAQFHGETRNTISGTLSHERCGRSASLFKVKAIDSDGVRLMRRRRRRGAPALLGINGGAQLLHGARRRYAERLVEVNRRCKLLADEVIAPREFGIARERSLDAIDCRGGLASQPHTTVAAPRSRGALALYRSWSCQPRSISSALSSSANRLRA